MYQVWILSEYHVSDRARKHFKHLGTIDIGGGGCPTQRKIGKNCASSEGRFKPADYIYIFSRFIAFFEPRRYFREQTGRGTKGYPSFCGLWMIIG